MKVVAPLTQDLHPGQVATYVFQVQNFGSTDTFRVSATDDKGFSLGPNPNTLTLNNGQTASVNVQLLTPPTAVVNTSDTLTVSIESTGTSGARNFAVITSLVGPSNRPPDVSQSQPSISTLWPPNHKMVTVSILGVTDPDGDPVTLTVTAITQNEPTKGLGSGDTCPDAGGVGSSSVTLRAERDGGGKGRVYTVFFTATDGGGGSSQGSVNIVVPHDQGTLPSPTAGSFDSTTCPL